MSFLALGCSGSAVDTASPDVTTDIGAIHSTAGGNSHSLWGLWQGHIDPVAQTIDFTQLRAAEFHLNALPFLEPPALVYLSLETLHFDGNIIDANIGLRHPFLGLTEFTGFDVCGIFISNGSVSGFSDPALVMAGDGDTRLLNPDGYSRWWNPSEFPSNGTIFGYTDGLLGAPDSFADYNCTLNGYKYFCDDLDDPDDPLSDVILENRGMFSAGQKNVRHYKIDMSAGLIFNYAVDANWKFPQGDPPWTAPDDFADEANRAEAWNIVVSETDNTLFNDGEESGGGLSLSVDVYDWFNADMNTVRVESPGNFAMVQSAIATGGGEGYSTYEIDIADSTPAAGEIPLLISVASEVEDFEGFITGTNATAYFAYTAAVSGEAPGGYHWEYGTIGTFAGGMSGYGDTSEFDAIGPAIIEESDGDIGLTFTSEDANDINPNVYSVWWVGLSTDSNVSYGGFLARDHGINIHRGDCNKIWYGALADAWATSKFSQGNYLAYIARIEPFSVSRGVFISNTQGNIEVLTDPEGYIYCIDDAGDTIQLKHSTAPNTIDPWTWHLDPYVFFQVASSGRCSHSRSVGVDSSGMMWLSYYSPNETQVKMAHPTDASPHEAWDDSTVVYTAGGNISQVRNPSLWIDGDDEFHICYTRFGMLTGEYELVYTKDDSSFGDPSEQVIFGAPGEITEAHISVGEKFGKEVVIIIYEHEASVFLATLVDGFSIGPPEEIDDNTDDIDPDAIIDKDDCNLHAIWSTMDVDNYDLAVRNGVLLEE